MYLEVHLEPEDGTPELLKLAFNNVAEALSQSHMSPEQAKLHQQKLGEILSGSGSDVIYGLSSWLNDLGLKLTVAVDDKDESES